MSRQLLELEVLLQQLIAEHRKLLAHVEAHEAAMKTLNLEAMDDAASLQEASRLRIAMLETKRRQTVSQLCRALNMAGEPTMERIAHAFPVRRDYLLKLRAELKGLMTQI